MAEDSHAGTYGCDGSYPTRINAFFVIDNMKPICIAYMNENTHFHAPKSLTDRESALNYNEEFHQPSSSISRCLQQPFFFKKKLDIPSYPMVYTSLVQIF